MDASVMDSAGRLGAVMALRDARNPVLVARAVTETPHVALAGVGADLFARQMGFEPASASLRGSPETLPGHASPHQRREAPKEGRAMEGNRCAEILELRSSL